MILKTVRSLSLFCFGFVFLVCHADEIRIAAASNFSLPLKQLAEMFEKQSSAKLILSFGSTGKLYTQIKNGAPFDVFLAADREHVRKLIEERSAIGKTAISYAVGRLVLWSPRPGFVDAQGQVLKNGNFRHLSLANPKLAPYGVAAKQVLNGLGFWNLFEPRLVLGESLAQAYQFVASGNAELGFVALSQIKQPGDKKVAGSFWLVPKTMYAPIYQDAVLIKSHSDRSSAKRFLEFLISDEAKKVILEFGYDSPN